MTTVNDNIIFVARIPSLLPEAYRHLSHLIFHLTRVTTKRLLITLVCDQFDDGSESTRATPGRLDTGANAASATEAEGPEREQKDEVQWQAIQRLLTFVYVQASKIASEQDNLLLQIDVLLKAPHQLRTLRLCGEDRDRSGEDEFDVLYRFENDRLELSPTLTRLPQRTLGSFTGAPHGSSTSNTDGAAQEKSDEFSTPLSRLPVIALGGTFDHLHAGHKILLSMAAWLASRKLIAGVTDSSLLGSKSNKEYLEPLETRISQTRQFLKLFKPSLQYDVVPIKDVYGPTGWDPDVQGLVVSRETLSGASAIATHRAAHDLPPLETYVIDVISHSDESIALEDTAALRKAKMSSTAIREWIAARHAQG